MEHDSVEIWGKYQDLHDAFETRPFTAKMAFEIVSCSEKDLSELFSEGLLFKDGPQYFLAHAEGFKNLEDELRHEGGV